MAAKENSGVSADKIKLAAAISVLLLSIVVYYSFPEVSALIRVAGILLGLGIAGFVALQTEVGRRVWAFALEARVEVRKVVWPTRSETIQTTLIVLAMVLVVAIMLWILDSILLWVVGLLTGQGG